MFTKTKSTLASKPETTTTSLKRSSNAKKNLQLLLGADEAITMSGVAQKDGRHIQETDLGLIKKPLLLKDNKNILFTGTLKEFNAFYKNNKNVLGPFSEKKISGTLMPGFVESHTHLVFAGDRRHEFELRNQGVSYNEIARLGGGISYTCAQTQKATKADLLKLAQARLEAFKKQGVVLLECKSGYGPDLKTELKILEVNDSLKGIETVSTFLGLHAVHGKSKQHYVSDVINKYLPQVHKKTKTRHADIFIDEGYFENKDLEVLVHQVKKIGWTFTAHADQLSAKGAGLKACELGALSISHCVEMQDLEIKKAAQTKTVFNLLPAADFYLKLKYPKARLILDQGGKVSLATDFNPGSSPTLNLNFVGVLARLEMKMTLPEVIAAYTFNAACALGQQQRYGALNAGYTSKIQILEGSWRDLFYSI